MVLALTMPALFGPIWVQFASSLPAPFGTLSGMVLLLLLITSTATDLRNRKIYNWATYSACVWALLVNSTIPAQGTGLSSSLAGATYCFGFMLFAYTLARGGAGDVKLATAIGALLGPDAGILAIAFSYVFAGAYIVVTTSATFGPVRFLSAFIRSLTAFACPQLGITNTTEEESVLKRPIPLAPFFAIGTLNVLLFGVAS